MLESEFSSVNAVAPQPPPKAGKAPITDLVIRDLQTRREGGVRKYGVQLESHNGRDALIDAYAEALDLCLYLRQAIEERGA